MKEKKCAKEKKNHEQKDIFFQSLDHFSNVLETSIGENSMTESFPTMVM